MNKMRLLLDHTRVFKFNYNYKYPAVFNKLSSDGLFYNFLYVHLNVGLRRRAVMSLSSFDDFQDRKSTPEFATTKIERDI